MQNFTVYDPATGNIIRSGQCMDCDLNSQAGPGEACVSGYITSYLSHRIDITDPALAPVLLTSEEVDAKREALFPQAESGPDPMDVLLEALRAKGIIITDADLGTAQATLSTEASVVQQQGS